MDFIQEIIGIEETPRELKAHVILRPNPERYDFKVIKGEEGYYDKFDNIFIPVEELKKAAPQLNGMPIYYSPPKIADADEYISGRILHIQEFFKEKS